ncbi:hypothetical protein [Paenibacillus polymyxa]|uniref:hypothetical protein n=1 Tax=Paenibacillus polymyxa TaxID=1406 RepID=UPI001E3CC22F|nr:hypothetical protein [Paenibacillus polymyxa]
MISDKLFALVLVVLILSGCGVNKEAEVKNIAPKPSTSTVVSPEITEGTSKVTVEDTRKTNVQDSNTLDQFIKKIQPPNEQLQKVLKEDLDRDGKPEYVLAFGLEKGGLTTYL